MDANDMDDQLLHQQQYEDECDNFEMVENNEKDRAEAARSEFFQDSDDDQNFIVQHNSKTYCLWCLKSLDCLKVVCMIGIICYFWVWTADNRLFEVDVLQQMCRRNELNMTFHDDKLVTGQSWDTYNTTQDLNNHEQDRLELDRYHEGAQGHMPIDIQWEDSAECKNNYTNNGTVNYKCIKHSTNLWDASLAIARSEIGDKTFLLLIIFTIMWSPKKLGYQYVKQDADKVDHKSFHTHNGHMHAHINLHQINPFKIIVYTSIGQIYINIKSLLIQHDIYANEVRLIVAVLLCIFLVYYMYDIVKQHLSNITKIEQSLKRDDDEKYACNKNNVLDNFQKVQEAKNNMKKLQKGLAEKYQLTDYITMFNPLAVKKAKDMEKKNNKAVNQETKEEKEQKKQQEKQQLLQNQKIAEDSMKFFILQTDKEKQNIIKEAEAQKEIERSAKLNWKRDKYKSLADYEDKIKQQKIDKEEKKTKQVLKLKEGFQSRYLSKFIDEEENTQEEKANQFVLKTAALGAMMKQKAQQRKLQAEQDAAEAEVNQSMAFEANESKVQDASEANSRDGEKDKVENEKLELSKDMIRKSIKKQLLDNMTDGEKEKMKEKAHQDTQDKLKQDKKKAEQLNSCARLWNNIKEFVKRFFFDIFFLIFMGSQEVDDTSFLKQFQYRSRFDIETLCYGMVVAHISMNVIVVTTSFLFVWLFVTQNQAGLFAVSSMYFICVYEFSFHILNWASTYLELGYIV